MQSNIAIKTTFLISLLGHCLVLGMPRINIALHQDKQPEDLVIRVEIEKTPLLPEIDVMGEEKKLKETVEEEELPEPEPKEQVEETIIEKPESPPEIVEVINPESEAMLRYQDMVKQRIEAARRYPSCAKKQGIEGISYLKFHLLSNGTVQDIRIIRSSGFDILDEEAVSTIKRASPFKPIPNKFNCSSLTMELALVFRLN